MADFPASYAPAANALSLQFFLDELSKVSIFHTIRYSIRRNLPLYAHYPDPGRDNFLDLGDQSCRFLCPVRLIFSGPPVLIQLSSRCYETWIDLEHVRAMGRV